MEESLLLEYTDQHLRPLIDKFSNSPVRCKLNRDGHTWVSRNQLNFKPSMASFSKEGEKV